MKRSRAVAAVMLAGALAIPGGADSEGETAVHTVKKGETLSLICIDYYGHYTRPMGTALQKLNPALKDVNLIVVGQKLKLRDVKTSKPGEAAIAVLERKVNITQGVVTYVQGNASLKRKDTAKRSKLSANTIVGPGDILKTGKNGRVELIINRESVVRMRENSRLVLDKLRDMKAKNGTTEVSFSIGTLWAKVRKFAGTVSRFQMDLPTAVAGVHGTVYQSSVAADKSAEVKVYNGEVAVSGKAGESGAEGRAQAEVSGPREVPGPHEVTMEEWAHIVRSMQRIRIDNTGTASEPETFEKADDDWEKWNERRDMRIAEMFAREF